MILTKYYVIYQRKNEDYLLINTLACKILEVNKVFIDEFSKAEIGRFEELEPHIREILTHNNFLYNSSEEEQRIIEEAYEEYKLSLNKLPLTNFIFLTYNCNLRCTYCCYRYLDREVPVMNKALMDNMFYVMSTLQEEKQKPVSRIVLSGGEPLMPENEKEIKYFFDKLEDFVAQEEIHGRRVVSSIFTNATNIGYFENFLRQKRHLIDMVYVTLNGPKEIHDKHRIQRDKKGSFDMTIAGINRLLELGIPIWTVANIGKDNVHDLSKLSKLVKEMGWKKNPIFQGIYISRIKNHKKEDKITIAEHEMVEIIVDLVKKGEIDIRDFNFGDLRLLRVIMDFIVYAQNKEVGKKIILQFSGCNNRASQYSYSVDGRMYPCAPSMGIPQYATGAFYPEINLKNIDKSNWLDRLLPSIGKCKDCKVAFLCGGGCSFEAIEKNNDVDNPICVKADKILNTFLSALENNIKIVHDDILYK